MQSETSTANESKVGEQTEDTFIIEELEARFEMEAVPSKSVASLLMCGCWPDLQNP